MYNYSFDLHELIEDYTNYIIDYNWRHWEDDFTRELARTIYFIIEESQKPRIERNTIINQRDFLIENYNNSIGVLDEEEEEKALSLVERFCELGGGEYRICSECKSVMIDGYCVDSGREYYCGDECLHKHFTDEEWDEEYEDNKESYYTEWY